MLTREVHIVEVGEAGEGGRAVGEDVTVEVEESKCEMRRSAQLGDAILSEDIIAGERCSGSLWNDNADTKSIGV